MRVRTVHGVLGILGALGYCVAWGRGRAWNRPAGRPTYDKRLWLPQKVGFISEGGHQTKSARAIPNRTETEPNQTVSNPTTIYTQRSNSPPPGPIFKGGGGGGGGPAPLLPLGVWNGAPDLLAPQVGGQHASPDKNPRGATIGG